MSEPMPDPALGSQAIPTTPCDVCGIAFGPGDVWNYHARLGVYVHSKCAADFPVRGEDITTHTVLWGQIPETPSTPTGPEVTAAMKAEGVDAGLVEKAARAMWSIPPQDPDSALAWPSWDVAVERADAGLWDLPQMVADTRNLVRHALAAVLPEIQAQALEEAATTVGREVDVVWPSPRHTDVAEAASYAAEVLRANARAAREGKPAPYAARLTAATEEPTT